VPLGQLCLGAQLGKWVGKFSILQTRQSVLTGEEQPVAPEVSSAFGTRARHL
jgi:hypothetical protein